MGNIPKDLGFCPDGDQRANFIQPWAVFYKITSHMHVALEGVSCSALKNEKVRTLGHQGLISYRTQLLEIRVTHFYRKSLILLAIQPAVLDEDIIKGFSGPVKP
jgi:hypothetical protein